MLKRQGDLLFELVTDPMPVRFAAVGSSQAANDDVIARGETTGHVHRVVNGRVGWGAPQVGGAPRIVQAEKGCKIVHEEHADLPLEPGAWLIHQQQEYLAPGEMQDVFD